MAETGLPKIGSVLGLDGLQALIVALAARGREVIGPVEREGAIVTGRISGIADLPAGRTDRQEAGTYRLADRGDGALFGYAVGPHAWKRYLHRATETLFRVRRIGEELAFDAPREPPPPTAFIGVRACELAAMAIQDRVFQGGPYLNTEYAARRSQAFLVVVNCGDPAATCFCTSMDTGPRVRAGYDIALTELLDGRHEFLAEPGSDAGAALLAYLPTRPVAEADWQAADAVAARAAAGIRRHLPAAGIKDALQHHPEHPRWDDVAERCLACANCTLVCPTCFCSTVEDRSDLDGAGAARVRRWDSCFDRHFSYVHGGAVRTQTRSHYRQWMTHKLAHWWDQFASSGCVGCGRCIAWCPVGIDITAEAAAFVEGEAHGDA
jgi:Fe-S-cluster-containing hydrogenase component 2